MPRRRSLAFAVVIAAVSAGLAACREAPAALGSGVVAARANAGDLFGGLAVRFVNVQRHPKFAAGRQRLARHALSPSRLIGDTALWTGAPAPNARVLELEGRPNGTAYLFTPRAGATVPDRTGESRHTMRLQRLGEDEFQWLTLVEHALGPVAPADVAAGASAWLAGLQRPDADLRDDARATLPRSAAALGRLFVLDSARSTRLADGSSLVDLRIVVDPARLRPTMPAFADYAEKYVKAARMTMSLTDGRGARWLDVRMGKGVMAFRFRTRDGALVSMDASARPLPDSTLIEVSAFERFLIFDVGVSGLVGDFTMVRTPAQRGWLMRFHRKPKWHLPLAVRHLISGALDRPFAREGILFSVMLRDDGPQTLLVRQLDVAVHESAIVRWLGGLGFKAMDDFAGRAEVEENRFVAEALYALRADVLAALGGTASGP